MFENNGQGQPEVGQPEPQPQAAAAATVPNPQRTVTIIQAATEAVATLSGASQPQQPQPIELQRTIRPYRNTRCHPCVHTKNKCDYDQRLAAAEAAGVNTTANPIVCSNCERKAGNRRAFQTSWCSKDTDVSINAGFREYVNTWREKHPKN